jgi:hypothetical protein
MNDLNTKNGNDLTLGLVDDDEDEDDEEKEWDMNIGGSTLFKYDDGDDERLEEEWGEKKKNKPTYLDLNKRSTELVSKTENIEERERSERKTKNP